MKRFRVRPCHYEIIETLGEGLTSSVFRALRKDPKGRSEHQVALKVLKSENHVQVLQQEFKKLLKVQSKYCVQVFAWEELQVGPALVMEVVEGLPLRDLLLSLRAHPDLVREVGVQVFLGLQALHRSGLVHGDLNLKNILIREDGLIKLIDFGFYDKFGVTYLTPEFADPAILQGLEPSPATDHYSLDRILHALGGTLTHQELTGETSRAERRRHLASLVRQFRASTKCQTQRILGSATREPMRLGKLGSQLLVGSLFFVATLLAMPQPTDPPLFARLEGPGSLTWAEVSLNGLPSEFLPLHPREIRSGSYRWTWRTSERSWTTTDRLMYGETFLLKPEPETL